MIFGTHVCRSPDYCSQLLQHANAQTDISAELAEVVSAVRTISRWLRHSRAWRRAGSEERWLARLERNPTIRNCVLFGAYLIEEAGRCRRFLSKCDSAGPLPKPLGDIVEAVRATSSGLDRELTDAMGSSAIERERPTSLWLGPAILLTLALVALGGALALLAVAEKASWQTVSTGTGEQRRVVLPDGSVVDLNTQSVLRYRVTATTRVVELLAGEARTRVAHEARPFVMLARDTSVHDLGTEFTTRIRASGGVEVRVAEGEIGLGYRQPTGERQYTVRLGAGYVANNDDGAFDVKAVGAAEIERRDAWRQGNLSFNGTPLSEAAGEFNRYNANQIEIVDPALRSWTFSGSNYSARSPERFLMGVLGVMPVRISVVDRGDGGGVVYQLRQATGPKENPLYGARLDEVALAFNLCNERLRIEVEGDARGAAVRLPIDLKKPEEFVDALVRSRAVRVRWEGDRVVVTER